MGVEKKATIVDVVLNKFIEDSNVWLNDNHNIILEKRERRIAFFIIQELYDMKSTSKSNLYPNVKEVFNVWLDRRINNVKNKHSDYLNIIFNDKDKRWMFNFKSTKNPRPAYLTSPHMGSVADKLAPIFIYRKGQKVTGQFWLSHILTLTAKGVELYNKWILPNKNKMNVSKKVSKEGEKNVSE